MMILKKGTLKAQEWASGSLKKLTFIELEK